MSYSVYIAAPFAARDTLRQYAQELSDIGMACTSSWLNTKVSIEEGQGAASSQPAEAIGEECRADLYAIDKSDAIVQFTGLAIEALRIPGANGPLLHSGGRHVELGYAIAKRKSVIVIGDPENIFQRSLGKVVADWHEAILALVSLEKRKHWPVSAEAAS